MTDSPEADPWLYPLLVECSCGRCRRGGECRDMRRLRERHRRTQDRTAALAALTEDDRTWLIENGWNGR